MSVPTNDDIAAEAKAHGLIIEDGVILVFGEEGPVQQVTTLRLADITEIQMRRGRRWTGDALLFVAIGFGNLAIPLVFPGGNPMISISVGSLSLLVGAIIALRKKPRYHLLALGGPAPLKLTSGERPAMHAARAMLQRLRRGNAT